MSFETLLAIAGFSTAIGGLTVVLGAKKSRRDAVVGAVLAAFLATTSAALNDVFAHDRAVTKLEADVLSRMGGDTWTPEKLHQEFLPRPVTLVNEALFRAVEAGTVDSRVIEFRAPSGALLPVRVYYHASD